MELLGFYREYKQARKRRNVVQRHMQRLRQDWLYSRTHPRATDADKHLSEYSAADFTHLIANPLKKKAVEVETEFSKARRNLLIQYWLIRVSNSFLLTLLFSFSIASFFVVIEQHNDFFSLYKILQISKDDYVEFCTYAFFVLSSAFIISQLNVISTIIFMWIYEIISRIGIIYFSISFSKIIWLDIPEFSGKSAENIMIFCMVLGVLLYLPGYLVMFFYRTVKKFATVDQTAQQSLSSYLEEKLAALRETVEEDIREYLHRLLEEYRGFFKSLEHYYLKYLLGSVSVGGIAATSETHRLSLLSVRLSTVW